MAALPPCSGIGFPPQRRWRSAIERLGHVIEAQEGGSAVLAQRLGKVTFSAFTSKGFRTIPNVDRPWLTYDPVAAHLPQAGWTETFVNASGEKNAGLLMHDLETAFETILHAPFRALLPDVVASKDERLIRLENQAERQEMYRDVWLMRHRDMRGVDRIDAATEWLAKAKLFGRD